MNPFNLVNLKNQRGKFYNLKPITDKSGRQILTKKNLIISVIFLFILSTSVAGQLVLAGKKLENNVNQLESELQPTQENLLTKINTLNADIQSIQAKTQEIETQASNLSNDVSNKDQKIQDLQSQKTQLETDAENKTAKITALEKELKKLQYQGTSKAIEVNLSTQTLMAYEQGELVKSFLISSGKASTPTKTGSYKIYAKYPTKTYSGIDYYYPNVKWSMRYDGKFLIHTAYWHNDFGTPVSHGCINMRESEAGWLYNWAPIGTPVKIFY